MDTPLAPFKTKTTVEKRALVKERLLDLAPEALDKLEIAMQEAEGKDLAKICFDILTAAGISTVPNPVSNAGSIAASAVAGAIQGMAAVYGVETDLKDVTTVLGTAETVLGEDNTSPSYDKNFISGLLGEKE